jgi:hypothetical protein
MCVCFCSCVCLFTVLPAGQCRTGSPWSTYIIMYSPNHYKSIRGSIRLSSQTPAPTPGQIVSAKVTPPSRCWRTSIRRFLLFHLTADSVVIGWDVVLICLWGEWFVWCGITVQLLFEKFETPACFLASSAVLNAFAAGKTTALVLDMGGGLTTAVPVFEGYKLQKGPAGCLWDVLCL